MHLERNIGIAIRHLEKNIGIAMRHLERNTHCPRHLERNIGIAIRHLERNIGIAMRHLALRVSPAFITFVRHQDLHPDRELAALELFKQFLYLWHHLFHSRCVELSFYGVLCVTFFTFNSVNFFSSFRNDFFVRFCK